MTTATTPRVEYEDRFAARPDLMAAAAEALAHLDRTVWADPHVLLPAAVRWSVRALDPATAELSMADVVEGAEVWVSRRLPAKDLTNPLIRDSHAIRTWGDLLARRSDRNMARIRELLRNLDLNDES